jgi:AcrR family transcriptional regulator
VGGGSRQERERRAMEEEIITTALAIVRSEGAANLSLRELAKRIDYSSAALYRYFDDKAALIQAVCQRGFRELAARLRGVPADLPADRRLPRLAEAYLRFAAEEGHLYTLMFVDLLPGPPGPPGPTPAPLADLLIGDTAFQVLYQTIAAGAASGRLRLTSDEVLGASIATWALVHGYAMLQQRLPGLLTERLIQTGLAVQLAGLRAEPATG